MKEGRASYELAAREKLGLVKPGEIVYDFRTDPLIPLARLAGRAFPPCALRIAACAAAPARLRARSAALQDENPLPIEPGSDSRTCCPRMRFRAGFHSSGFVRFLAGFRPRTSRIPLIEQ